MLRPPCSSKAPDAGRVLEVPYGVVDKIAKLIPEGPGQTLDECLKPGAELRKAMEDAVRSKKPTLINAVIDEAAGTESGRLTNLNPASTATKK